jgi:perosamine synthetase
VGGVAVTNDDEIARNLGRIRNLSPSPAQQLTESLLRNVILDYYQFKHPQRWWTGEFAGMLSGATPYVTTTRDEEGGLKPAGYGRRMPAPVAAIGLNQIGKIDRYNESRRKQARVWDNWSRARGYAPPRVLEGSTPAFLRYPILVDSALKKDVSSLREELGVEVGLWFTSHLHPVRDHLTGFRKADQAVAECINLPTLLS